MSLSVRAHRYRECDGWLVCGELETRAFPVRVFAHTQAEARWIKGKILRGEPWTFAEAKAASTMNDMDTPSMHDHLNT